jgi:hypothetical protein
MGTSDLFIMDEQQKRKGKKKWMDFQEDFLWRVFDVLGQRNGYIITWFGN